MALAATNRIIKIFKLKKNIIMKEELKIWLRERQRRDKHPKYQQYFEPWFEHLAESQIYYFNEQRKHIEAGSLINWITK